MLKWIIGILILVGGGVWLVSGRGGLPGEAVADQGREHRDHGKLDEFKYNSNPPASGPHDADWIRPGVYGEAQDKYKLIHSLEHGYVVVHYNCAKALSAQPSTLSVSAHEDNEVATDSGTIKTDCALGQQLADFAKKMELKKLIVQPNPTIDKPIIMVAWDRILKMDTFDEKLAEKFVKAFRNKGPEATME
ncbi:MAG: hypothetical protein UX99_C0002G0095 [Candidatus Amesbacteria bacterium GW2011_GWB1_47_26]|uniref:DUF3105 domain-containing protein n=1 Tax=Candidatus Amesbacteria bacterium GW2011_GWC2_45_19 TaxID=1618366 RepID=A0A0G1Q319_9BACT|nr:MAG: hypothetical protein UX05_C0004G0084 [Candidatus Amesbacteria bacterium GW2011_GWC2_45_19]KKU38743.1 MAG: hypothetical protein UX52_C0001G0025 [Candidatus Amesbacteria bacterium GW2011_GWA1_46_35]KKU69245.1 MAG: hypothetical protein UX93_C0002G0084 [Microgenomates group bacterium GW2011_GWC1_47_20]KKU75124.1 MAG: hypothetical protein UX99_C0002G0095 [Candidatus Amesbacteria bacterium GW2011_GWB1_47_26]KKU78851.1 MAG: hypothetical protein UY06_C0038G0011 [Candidatus Amesbacteria bacteriu